MTKIAKKNIKICKAVILRLNLPPIDLIWSTPSSLEKKIIIG
jgi:hypothetical protein